MINIINKLEKDNKKYINENEELKKLKEKYENIKSEYEAYKNNSNIENEK